MAIIVNEAEIRGVKETYEEVKKMIHTASMNGMSLIELHLKSYKDNIPDTPIFLNYNKLIEILPD